MTIHLPIANGYGDFDVRSQIPSGYQHIKGKRLQSLCRKLEIQYANALVGWTGGRTRYAIHDGVVVPLKSATKLLHAIQERKERSEKRRLREERKQERLLAEKRIEERQDFRIRFPNASERTLAKYAHSFQPVYNSLDDVPLYHLSKEEILELQLIKEHQVGVFLDNGGRTVVPLFRAQLPKDESSETPEQVHRRAAKMEFSAYKALWAANKLVKMVGSPLKREVYDLKEKLLRHWKQHLIESRVTRTEKRECWNCNGAECHKCDGTGIFSSRTLYETRFKFPNEERVYCYHCYTKPDKLTTDEPGVDKRSYGYRFTPEERKALPFGLYDLIKILRHELSLLEEIANQQKRDALMTKWNALGLPVLGLNTSDARIRECLMLIEQLTAD